MGTKPFSSSSWTAIRRTRESIPAWRPFSTSSTVTASRRRELSDSHYANGLEFVNNGKEPIHILDSNRNEEDTDHRKRAGEAPPLEHGDLSTRLSAAALRATGIAAVPLPSC
jgi:hypothetical protein